MAEGQVARPVPAERRGGCSCPGALYVSCTDRFGEVWSCSVPSPERGTVGHRKQRETEACRETGCEEQVEKLLSEAAG